MPNAETGIRALDNGEYAAWRTIGPQFQYKEFKTLEEAQAWRGATGRAIYKTGTIVEPNIKALANGRFLAQRYIGAHRYESRRFDTIEEAREWRAERAYAKKPAALKEGKRQTLIANKLYKLGSGKYAVRANIAGKHLERRFKALSDAHRWLAAAEGDCLESFEELELPVYGDIKSVNRCSNCQEVYEITYTGGAKPMRWPCTCGRHKQ